MAKMTVKFQRCIQDSQEYGSDDQHMVSRVFFSLHLGGQALGDFHADIKQVVGDDYETGHIEVGPPVGYNGSFNHHEFTRATEDYFRRFVGSIGSAIRIQGGATHVRMRNNLHIHEAETTFDLPES